MAAEIDANGRVRVHCSSTAEQLVGYGCTEVNASSRVHVCYMYNVAT